jgi:hypothetical protein
MPSQMVTSIARAIPMATNNPTANFVFWVAIKAHPFHSQAYYLNFTRVGGFQMQGT